MNMKILILVSMVALAHASDVNIHFANMLSGIDSGSGDVGENGHASNGHASNQMQNYVLYSGDSTVDEMGDFHGFEADLVNCVNNHQDMAHFGLTKLGTWQQTCWDTPTTPHGFYGRGGEGLNNREVDGCLDAWVTAVRKAYYDYSTPYMNLPEGKMLVKEGTTIGATSTIGYVAGSLLSDTYILGHVGDQGSQWTMSQVSSNEEGLQALEDGSIDALVRADDGVVVPGYEYVSVDPPMNNYGIGGTSVLARRGSAAMLEAWNSGFDACVSSGDYATFCKVDCL